MISTSVRLATLARVATLVLGAILARPAPAAFEWEPATPESWIAGESPYRWPMADGGRGARVDFAAARPWSWPEVRAAAVRAAFGGSSWTAGVSLAQLTAGPYRETRLAGGWERRLGAQGLAAVASLLEARVESEAPSRVTGAELDVAWTADFLILRLRAAATGVAQTGGAVLLGVPRTLGVSVSSRGPGAQLGARFEEGSRGRAVVIGLTAPAGPLRLGAGWSTGEPTVRCMAGVRRGRLALSAGIAWHSELPPSQVVALAISTRAVAP